MSARVHRGMGLLFAILTIVGTGSAAVAQTAFTYQGRLVDGGQPANGPHDLRFRVFTSQSGDIQVGLNYVDDLTVTDGLFTAVLDFGTVINGNERWIEISVRPGAWPNSDRAEASYAKLSPRQEVLQTPYAIYAHQAGSLDLPVDDSINALFAAFTITNDPHIAIRGVSANGSAFWAESDAGNGIYSSSDTGWAGFFQGKVNVTERLAINYGNITSLKLACNGDAAKPGGGSWSVLSDQRTKQNIRPLRGALDRVLALQGYTFEYTPAAQADGLALPGEQIGLVAQQVEQVFPDWVGEDTNGTKYVTERGTTALFVEALRELRAEKDAEIAALRAEIESLRAVLRAAETPAGVR